MKIPNFTIIDNRPPYCTDQDDEFKTLLMAGFPLPRNERIGMPPMIWAYLHINTTRYPFKVRWKGANAGNDEVLAMRQTAEQYISRIEKKHLKEKPLCHKL